jgi:hypothetical protein
MTPPEIVRFLELRQFPLNSESELQAAIWNELRRVRCEREVRLGPRDVVDFMIGSTAVEVKIKGSKLEIFRQCERYCAHERVHALVLATNRATQLPPAINGKPAYVANLGRAWL